MHKIFINFHCNTNKTWRDCKPQEFLVQRHSQTSSASPVPDCEHHYDVDGDVNDDDNDDDNDDIKDGVNDDDNDEDEDE